MQNWYKFCKIFSTSTNAKKLENHYHDYLHDYIITSQIFKNMFTEMLFVYPKCESIPLLPTFLNYIIGKKYEIKLCC